MKLAAAILIDDKDCCWSSECVSSESSCSTNQPGTTWTPRAPYGSQLVLLPSFALTTPQGDTATAILLPKVVDAVRGKMSPLTGKPVQVAGALDPGGL